MLAQRDSGAPLAGVVIRTRSPNGLARGMLLQADG